MGRLIKQQTHWYHQQANYLSTMLQRGPLCGWREGYRFHAVATEVQANSDSRLGAKEESFPKLAKLSSTSLDMLSLSFSTGISLLPLPCKFFQPLKFGEGFPKLHATVSCFSMVLGSGEGLGCSKGLKWGESRQRTKCPHIMGKLAS